MDSLSLAPFVAFPLLFLLGVAAFVGVGGLISRLGWAPLARAYPGDGEGGTLCTGRVGLARYKNSLFVDVADRGLGLSVLFFFRLGHPPIRIPWSAVRSVHRRPGLLMDSFEFRTPEGGVTLPPRLAERAFAFLDPEVPVHR